jgi:hypothetical protein
MEKVKLLLAVAMCVFMVSCLNINSFNKPDKDGGSEFSGGAIKSELYFGMQKPDETAVTDAEWQSFLDKNITPRFPDGLTVIDAYGQYKDAKGNIVKEKTKLLIIVHEGDKNEELEQICEEYMKAFSQEAVFRTNSRVSSSLDEEEKDDDGNGE